MVNERYQIIKGITDEIKRVEELNKFDNELKDKYSNQKASFEFLEKIKNTKSRHSFFVSELVFNEVFSVILEEYIARKLISKNIPIRFWTKNWNYYKGKTQLEEADEADIVNAMNEFFEIFINHNKIKMAVEKYDEFSISYLIVRLKVDTHDASIVAIGVANKCKFLITEDGRLRKTVKRSGFKKIQLISSQESREKIKF
jgi:predicted nucleic acid-binding protein